ncbi:Crp/Fnr family transcriptional regulator [Erythrobacter dokdonensis]|uniref:Putative transcriptional regulator n=1 Tax=Erythrobacter dokdonensis DSW-74 TaxID=1300349 RepID=A0A1A7BHY6_9SPHN|nr:Crp/Fnr family transcriptional regulator [Erythrobacter dokdonensis]OBV12168.1 putative transcriptional regulator [Erythrobacter dokdonensis DSW-74]
MVEIGTSQSPFHPGDDPSGLFGVVQGGIGVSITSIDDEMHLADVLRAGSWFGYRPFLYGAGRSVKYYFTAIEPSLLAYVSLPDLQAIAAKSAHNQRALFSLSDFALEIATRTIAALMIRNPQRRIAEILARVSVPAGEARDVHSSCVRLTQSQIGEMAALDRKVVNRALGRLVDRGLVQLTYAGVIVPDPAALRAFARQ